MGDLRDGGVKVSTLNPHQAGLKRFGIGVGASNNSYSYEIKNTEFHNEIFYSSFYQERNGSYSRFHSEWDFNGVAFSSSTSLQNKSLNLDFNGHFVVNKNLMFEVGYSNKSEPIIINSDTKMLDKQEAIGLTKGTPLNTSSFGALGTHSLSSYRGTLASAFDNYYFSNTSNFNKDYQAEPTISYSGSSAYIMPVYSFGSSNFSPYIGLGAAYKNSEFEPVGKIGINSNISENFSLQLQGSVAGYNKGYASQTNQDALKNMSNIVEASYTESPFIQKVFSDRFNLEKEKAATYFKSNPGKNFYESGDFTALTPENLLEMANAGITNKYTKSLDIGVTGAINWNVPVVSGNLNLQLNATYNPVKPEEQTIISARSGEIKKSMSSGPNFYYAGAIISQASPVSSSPFTFGAKATYSFGELPEPKLKKIHLEPKVEIVEDYRTTLQNAKFSEIIKVQKEEKLEPNQTARPFPQTEELRINLMNDYMKNIGIDMMLDGKYKDKNDKDIKPLTGKEKELYDLAMVVVHELTPNREQLKTKSFAGAVEKLSEKYEAYQTEKGINHTKDKVDEYGRVEVDSKGKAIKVENIEMDALLKPSAGGEKPKSNLFNSK